MEAEYDIGKALKIRLPERNFFTGKCIKKDYRPKS
jgi:hypothetical protein